MNSIRSNLRPAALATLVLATVTCGAYPLLVTGIAGIAFPRQAHGSLLARRDGSLCGSGLLGQDFRGSRYFHPRPSAAGTGYDAANSGGSNLGPTSRKLRDQIAARIAAYRAENGLAPDQPVPADAVCASGSGLDPHISPRNAALQLQRVAQARNLDADTVHHLVRACTEPTFSSFLGRPGVNVLRLNLRLDAIQ